MGKDDAELQAFLNPVPTEAELALQELQATDKDMARVAEDVIDVLITKQLLVFEDLPQTAQDVITERKNWRNKL